MKLNRPFKRILAFVLCVVLLSGETIVASQMRAIGAENTEMVLENSVYTQEAEKREPAENMETGESTELEKKAETAENTETAGNTENVKNTETEENTENTGTAGNTETTEGTKLPESTENIENTETVENTESTENIENTETVENTESTENIENTETVENTESKEIIENTEIVEETESTENVENTETVENTESTEIADNTEMVEDTEVPEDTEEVTVTLCHIDSATGNKIYADEVRKLTAGTEIVDYTKGNNWKVVKVIAEEEEEKRVFTEADAIAVRADTTIKVYYEATTGEAYGEATFYDYLVKPVWTIEDAEADGGYRTIEMPEWSMNTASNYSDSEAGNRLTAGTKTQNYAENQYDAYMTAEGGEKNANDYADGQKGLVPGLILGLSEDMSEVTFAMDEPGFFSLEEKTGKRILSGYTLQFARQGEQYDFSAVMDEQQEIAANAGNAFFPLDTAVSEVTDIAGGTEHNYYFGMRYDILFTLGDYIGPLNYRFAGDDELWAILDGKQVVLDFGGLHDEQCAEVDLWEALGLEEGVGAVTETEKSKEHRLTILYMERDGNNSNCEMNFTIPNAEITAAADTTTYFADNIEKSDKNAFLVQTTPEEIKETFTCDKTAELVDWENRSYDITLTANSTTTYTTGGDTTVTITKPKVDVVLVLDVSDSMNSGSCLSDLKTASSNFVQGVYDNAHEDSQIAIVTFNTNASTVQQLTKLTKSNIGSVKKKITNITADGGTNQAKGLELANQILKNSTNENKYVILFTDGKPDTNGPSNTSDETPIAAAAYDYAEQIKKYATLYTVRLGDLSGGSVSYCVTGTHYEGRHEVTDYKYTKRTYAQWLGDIATDAGHALSVSGSNQLNTIFEQIKNEVTTPAETVYVPVSGALITDVIDARFELTEEERNRLIGDGARVTDNADGTTSITWQSQTINVEAEDGTPGFCKVLHVKAKEDYIGGNAVATNVNPGSYIEVKGEKTEFAQPQVNVKVNLEVGNHKEEIFLGETVPVEAAVLQHLINVENLAAGYGIEESSFTLTWYEDKELTSEISISDMESAKPDIQGVQYYLKVTYDAGMPTEESNRNTMAEGQVKYNGTPETGYKVEAVNREDGSLNYGIYTITVIDGKIIITKTIPQGSYKKNQGDPIFTFKITNTDSNKVYYRTLRFKEAKTTTLTTTLEGLEKGHYLVEELNTIRYDMTGLAVNTEATGCAYRTEKERAVFAIGYTKANEAGAGYLVPEVKQINGQEGSVRFTNEKLEESREITDTDVVKNTFVVDKKTSATKDADNGR